MLKLAPAIRSCSSWGDCGALRLRLGAALQAPSTVVTVPSALSRPPSTRALLAVLLTLRERVALELGLSAMALALGGALPLLGATEPPATSRPALNRPAPLARPVAVRLRSAPLIKPEPAARLMLLAVASRAPLTWALPAMVSSAAAVRLRSAAPVPVPVLGPIARLPFSTRSVPAARLLVPLAPLAARLVAVVARRAPALACRLKLPAARLPSSQIPSPLAPLLKFTAPALVRLPSRGSNWLLVSWKPPGSPSCRLPPRIKLVVCSPLAEFPSSSTSATPAASSCCTWPGVRKGLMAKAAVPADSWVGTPLLKLPCHTKPLPPRLRLAPAPPATLSVEPAAALNRPPAWRLTSAGLAPVRCTRLPLWRLMSPALATLRAPLALRPA